MFKRYHLTELTVDASSIFRDCSTTVGHFTTDRHEHSLNIGGIIELKDFKILKTIEFSGHDLIVHLRALGYLVDWNAMGFLSVKCLYRQVEECHLDGAIKPFKPDILEDLKDLTDFTDLTASGSSKASA